MARKGGGKKAAPGGLKPPSAARTEVYRHPEAESLLRPDVGTQAQFRKKKQPVRYRYDSSLSPALDFDGQNPARELGDWLLGCIREAAALPAPHEFAKPRSIDWRDGVIEVRGLADAVDQLERLGKPFLDWAGKAERLSFDVPTLPLFVHERLSTKAILETLKGHKRDRQADWFELFADPKHAIHDQVLRAYEYPDKWVNRMALGDSLVVMNSLLHYEGMGGQVQMIYMDPPYGVKFGSNFQPFVRKRDVSHNDDEDMTREPEMVKAYRDTWELGLHSYLTYLRDRLYLCHDLLAPAGSIFVQINDENLHHVRELMEEVFGSDCHIVTILIKKKGSQKSSLIDPVNDYLLWYSKTPRDEGGPRFNPIFLPRDLDDETLSEFSRVELPDGSRHSLRAVPRPDGSAVDYRARVSELFAEHPGVRLFRPWPITNVGTRPNQMDPIDLDGRLVRPPKGCCWRHTTRTSDGSTPGMERLKSAGRLMISGNALDYVRYLEDFPFKTLSNWWDGLGGASDPVYVVQTNTEIVKRCILMTTRPGDLVLDPTCGSGTTAYVAEEWGRRWITIDTSRVPLALARQRLLTATFRYFQLSDPARGPAGGFRYEKSNGRRVAGIVTRITSGSIAGDEPPEEIVLVDRPETESGVTRVTGPFCFEATIPTPVDWEGDGQEDSGVEQESYGSFVDRMLEVLRKSPVLHLTAGKTVTLHHVRVPAKTLSLSAEAVVPASDGEMRPRDGGVEPTAYPIPPTEDATGDPARVRIQGAPVAIVFGPESGAVSEKLVFEAAREAHAKSYAHLYVIGFAIQPNARELVEKCEAVVGVPATYVQATPDLMMGDLLKNMRSSQIFSVCGLPDVEVRASAPEAKGAEPRFEVELMKLNLFDPVGMETSHKEPNDVPAWFLDTDYNGLCFHVCQAFFPRTAAWDDLKRALRGEFEDSVWEHLAGTVSAPFEAGEHRSVAVKVIDDRGNELLVVRPLPKASK